MYSTREPSYPPSCGMLILLMASGTMSVEGRMRTRSHIPWNYQRGDNFCRFSKRRFMQCFPSAQPKLEVRIAERKAKTACTGRIGAASSRALSPEQRLSAPLDASEVPGALHRFKDWPVVRKWLSYLPANLQWDRPF